MTCLNERIAGATIFFMLSGFAFADSLVSDLPEEMTVSNIAPLPMEVIAPIPEPQHYLQRYEMEYQSNRSGPYFAQLDNFYSAQLTNDFQFGAAKATPRSEVAPRAASNYLLVSPSTAPQLSLVDLPNTTLAIGAQPQRRLSLTVNEWVFSATARIAIFHSHSTGATLSVRRGF